MPIFWQGRQVLHYLHHLQWCVIGIRQILYDFFLYIIAKLLEGFEISIFYWWFELWPFNNNFIDFIDIISWTLLCLGGFSGWGASASILNYIFRIIHWTGFSFNRLLRCFIDIYVFILYRFYCDYFLNFAISAFFYLNKSAGYLFYYNSVWWRSWHA